MSTPPYHPPELDEALSYELELVSGATGGELHYDNALGTCTTTYRGTTMTMRLPPHYPHTNQRVKVSLSHHHHHNNNKVGSSTISLADVDRLVEDTLTDLLPGEPALLPLYMAFRNAAERFIPETEAVAPSDECSSDDDDDVTPMRTQASTRHAENKPRGKRERRLQKHDEQDAVKGKGQTSKPAPKKGKDRKGAATPPPVDVEDGPAIQTHNMNVPRPTSEYLTPSDKIYKRLMWDRVFPKCDFDVGYDDRFLGVQWMALTKFRTGVDPTKEVPFHRVQYFRYKGTEIIWDRKERRDSVDALAERLARAAEEGEPDAVAFGALPSNLFGCEGVDPISDGEYPAFEPVTVVPRDSPSDDAALPSDFSIMTFNVLFDLFDHEQNVQSERRVPLQVAALRSCGADIIALQEVTPQWFQNVLVRELVSEYHMTCVAPGARSGQVVLSRVPFVKASIMRLSTNKHCVVASVRAQPDVVVTVMNAHLISDHSNQGNVRRPQEIATIGQHVPRGVNDRVVLLGDFNFGVDDAEETSVTWSPFVDVWADLRGSEPGYSFDRERNPLAAITSTRRMESRRLDRIKVWGLLPVSVALHADVPSPDGLFPSDHFAVLARVVVEGMTCVDACPPGSIADPMHALVIVPPPELWESFDMLRRAYDKGAARWMPHITVLHPFLMMSQGTSNTQHLIHSMHHVCRRTHPFRVRLSKLGRKTDSTSNRVYAYFEAECLPPYEGNLQLLVDTMFEAYPICRKDAAPRKAHMTIGQFYASEVDRKIREIQSQWTPVEFDVTHLHVIARVSDDQPMNVVHSVPLHCRQEAPDRMTAQPIFATRIRGPCSAEAAAAVSEPPSNMILEAPTCGSKELAPYCPEDALETWMLTVTMTEYARTCPTHISQRGAMYHVPPTELCAYLQKWEDSIRESDKVPFFIEEVRGDVFRLYVDVDFKSTTHTKIELDKTGFVPVLLTHAAAVFPEADLTVCITECHGKWEDRYHPDTVYKSGFRFYFQNVWVNERVFRNFLDSLARVCEELLTMTSNAPRSVTWPEAVNTHSSIWDRTRLIGTIKKRRNAWRRYKLLTFVSATGDASEFAESRSKDKVLQVSAVPAHTTEAAQDVHKLLFATTVRVWDTQDEASIKAVLHNNAFAESKMYLEDRVNEAYMKPLLGNRRRRNKDSKEGSGKEGEEGVVQEQGPDDAVATPSRPRADSELPNTPQMEPSL
eukprot:PhM_4_TR10947/c1_g1_i3/m.88524